MSLLRWIPSSHSEHLLAYHPLTKSYPKTHLSKTNRGLSYTLSKHTYIILKTTYDEINTLTVHQNT